MARMNIAHPPVACIYQILISNGYSAIRASAISKIIDDELSEFMHEHEVALISTTENLTFCEFNMKDDG